MPSRFALVLVGLAFLVTVIIRMPASVLPWLLPSGLRCIEPSGTLWQGACARVQFGAGDLTDTRWSLHAGSLLRARLQLELDSGDPRALGHAVVALRRDGQVQIDDLSAHLPLQGGLLAILSGWNGQLELQIAHATLLAGHLTAIDGHIRLLQLHLERPAMDFGSFELEFPPDNAGQAPVGSLHDLNGPVALQGSVRLSGNAYQLDALLAARDARNIGLQQMLQLLGPADPQGRHSISFTGTY